VTGDHKRADPNGVFRGNPAAVLGLALLCDSAFGEGFDLGAKGMITEKELQEWKKLCDEATPGPWYATISYYDVEVEKERNTWTVGPHSDGVNWENDSNQPGYGMWHDDAKFAALARTAMPRLIEEVERLQRIIAREVTENDELGSEFVYVMALKDDVKRYREALEWYADKENYEWYVSALDAETIHDSGERARKALGTEPKGSA